MRTRTGGRLHFLLVPAAPSQPEVWTTRGLLGWIQQALDHAAIDSPRLCAELLVSHVIGCERLRLYMDADRPATNSERELLRSLVGRALRHEPVQYLTQTAWFFSLPFFVDKRVLIPRPSTETLVEAALVQARTLSGPVHVADVCTGSGCIAIALLDNLPDSRALATDIDPQSLEVAQHNAEQHSIDDRIEFVPGNGLAPLLDREPVDILLSNPPYIPDSEWEDIAENVKQHEPAHALRAGPEGLDIIAPIVEKAASVLTPGGMLGLEVAASHAHDVRSMLVATGQFQDCNIRKDADGLDRVVTGIRLNHNKSG